MDRWLEEYTEMAIARHDKYSAIQEIHKHQVELMHGMIEDALKLNRRINAGRKTNPTGPACIAMAKILQYRSLEIQKRMIIAQPYPPFEKGGIIEGKVITGEAGREIIANHEDPYKYPSRKNPLNIF